MTKKTKTDESTDEPTNEPSIEDRLADATKRYLEDVEQVVSPELGKRKVRWSTTTPLLISRAVAMDLGRALRPKVKVAPRPPHDAPPTTDPPAGSQQRPDTPYGSGRRKE